MSYKDRKDSTPSTSGYTPYGGEKKPGGLAAKLQTRPDFSNLPAFEKVGVNYKSMPEGLRPLIYAYFGPVSLIMP